jgi:hypothetical protein
MGLLLQYSYQQNKTHKTDNKKLIQIFKIFNETSEIKGIKNLKQKE